MATTAALAAGHGVLAPTTGIPVTPDAGVCPQLDCRWGEHAGSDTVTVTGADGHGGWMPPPPPRSSPVNQVPVSLTRGKPGWQ